MIDNVRADRYRAYNPKTRVKTPVFDQLAQTGTLFTRGLHPGHGVSRQPRLDLDRLYPKQHHFIDPKARLSPGWVTLPERSTRWPLHGGLDRQRLRQRVWGFGRAGVLPQHPAQGRRPARRGACRPRHRVHQGPGRRAVLPLYRDIDPHVSWRGRQPWLKEYHPSRTATLREGRLGKDVEKIAVGQKKVTPADKLRIAAIYDSTVSYNDHHLGRLSRRWRSAGSASRR